MGGAAFSDSPWARVWRLCRGSSPSGSVPGRELCCCHACPTPRWIRFLNLQIFAGRPSPPVAADYPAAPSSDALSAMDTYNEHAFKRKLALVMKQVKRVLDTTRNPKFPADVPHEYDDKYVLVELGTKAAAVGQLNVLDDLGLTAEKLKQCQEWAASGRAVSLRFESKETCAFDRTTTREVESATKYVVESAPGGKKTHRAVTAVTEHFWRFGATWGLCAFAGAAPDDGKLVVSARRAAYEMKTSSKHPPREAACAAGPLDLDISWLMARFTADGAVGFRVDRKARGVGTTHTPHGIEAFPFPAGAASGSVAL